MIVPRSIVAPIALLVALTTTTVAFNAGIAAAPSAFFGDESIVVIGPPGDAIPGQSEIDVARVGAMRTLPSVEIVSPEVFALVAIDGTSAFVRGVEFEHFLALEGARLVEGRMPAAPHEALAGVGFARMFDVDVPGRLLVPSSFERVALPIEVVGIVELEGPAREELLLDIADARVLMGMASGQGHVIRVRSSDPQALTALIGSLGPVFTLADVRLSATEFVPGEPVLAYANLTNWGRVGGVHDVVVRSGNDVVGSRAYYVDAHRTVPVEVPFALAHAGSANISINPSFLVTVRDPTLFFQGLPPALALGRPYNVTVVDRANVPAAGVIVSDGATEATTDADGRAELVARRAGVTNLVAIVDGATQGAISIPVAEPGFEDAPHIVVTGLATIEPIVGTSAPFHVRVTGENRGGVAGAETFRILLDGAPAANATLAGRPGDAWTATIELGPVEAGTHEVAVEGTGFVVSVRAYAGADPRIEALLEGYRSVATAGPGATHASDAESYVTRVVGDIRTAVLALSIASGILAALGAVAVLHRHLAEREPHVGTLKGIGATDAYVLQVATREAAVAGGIASALGLAAGVALAALLDATGLVYAFGHAIHPVHEWYALALILLLATTFVVASTRAILALALRRPVDALMRGSALRPTIEDPPALKDLLGGAS